jgi:hypothetical protein
MCRGSRGHTLLELLVAGGLGALLFFMGLGLMAQVSGIVSKTMALNELQQVGEVTARRLARQVASCDAGGAAFLVRPDLVMLALHPVSEVTPSAKKVYANRLTVYAWLPRTATLYEMQGGLLADSDRFQPLKLGPAAMESFLLEDRPRRPLCEYLSKVELTTPDGGFPLLLRLTMQKSAYRYGMQTVILERFLCLRNLY